jgi:hypothetical protein
LEEETVYHEAQEYFSIKGQEEGEGEGVAHIRRNQQRMLSLIQLREREWG